MTHGPLYPRPLRPRSRLIRGPRPVICRIWEKDGSSCQQYRQDHSFLAHSPVGLYSPVQIEVPDHVPMVDYLDMHPTMSWMPDLEGWRRPQGAQQRFVIKEMTWSEFTTTMLCVMRLSFAYKEGISTSKSKRNTSSMHVLPSRPYLMSKCNGTVVPSIMTPYVPPRRESEQDPDQSNLWNIIHRGNKKLPYSSRIRIGQDIEDAIVAMHDSSICHGDIKPSNCLVKADEDDYSDAILTLIDFEFALVSLDDDTVSTQSKAVHTRSEVFSSLLSSIRSQIEALKMGQTEEMVSELANAEVKIVNQVFSETSYLSPPIMATYPTVRFSGPEYVLEDFTKSGQTCEERLLRARASDLFALGATLFELYTGKPLLSLHILSFDDLKEYWTTRVHSDHSECRPISALNDEWRSEMKDNGHEEDIKKLECLLSWCPRARVHQWDRLWR